MKNYFRVWSKKNLENIDLRKTSKVGERSKPRKFWKKIVFFKTTKYVQIVQLHLLCPKVGGGHKPTCVPTLKVGGHVPLPPPPLSPTPLLPCPSSIYAVYMSILAFDAATFVCITKVYFIIFRYLLPIVPVRLRWCNFTERQNFGIFIDIKSHSISF